MVYLFRTLGITTQEAPKLPASANVMEFLRKGDKNGAIRAFREETGSSLKDAKTFIESLQYNQS
jgi:ribosomal protein L7/L12